MATLEDAAEALVVKLRGLDSEIEESEGKLDDLRERVEDVTREVEQEWTSLSEAATSFLRRLGEEQERLAEQGQETAQAVVDAQNAATEHGAGAREEIEEGRARLEALGQHAAGLEPGVESLAAEVGEAPAQALAERARELQQELDQVVEQARAFLADEVAPAATDAAEEIRQACQTLHDALGETAVAALQQVYDDWESMVDRLEEYVVSQGYEASHQHARDVVEYAMEECGTACRQQLDELQQLMGVLMGQLKEMVTEVEQSAEHVVAQTGAELLRELEATESSARSAVAALDGVKQELAQYSFVEV